MLRKNIALLLTLFTFSFSIGIAQITSPEKAKTAQWMRAQNFHYQEVILPEVDVAALLAEDERDASKGVPFRFGYPHEVDFNINSNGTWMEMKKGDRLWMMSFTSFGAYSLNFLFDEFHLPPGATLHLYNQDKSHVLGAFTSQNNKPWGTFGTVPVSGQTVILEYFEPGNVRGQGRINISSVIHAYKNFFKSARGFGDSGGCNNNVNCPEGAPWQAEKNAVAMIMLGGSRLCTGTMINSCGPNTVPYFLTANHCLGGQVPNWTFVFDYESPDCPNVNGSLANAVNGATLIASDSPSDFGLLELSQVPPPGYNVYLAGWDSRNTPPDSAVGIHHPAGDIMKISFDYDACVSSAGLSPQANTHWEVTDWDDGTTEGGSSGSALFDNEHRLIGQLHGGGAACGNNLEDHYGKFSYSWNTGGNASSRLRDWLDPNTLCPDTLNGVWLGSPDSLDAAMLAIVTPLPSNCDTSLVPEVTIRNQGSITLVSADINYQIDGGAIQTTNWTGSLGYFQSTNVVLPVFTVASGNHDIKVWIANTNGTPDQNAANDTLNQNFDAILGNIVTFNLLTDNYGDETTYELRTTGGTVLYSGGPFQNNTQYSFEFCLADGCYDFEIFDDYGDGICCGFGNGNYNLEDINGTIVSGGQFGSNEVTQFCVPSGPPPPPTAAIQASDVDVCAGTAILFTDVSTGGQSRQWYFTGGFPATGTVSPQIVSFPNAGTFDISLVSSNNGGQDSTSITIVVHPKPVANAINIVDESGAGANDGAVTAQVTGGTAPFSYSWNTNPVQTTQTATGLATGFYVCTVTDDNGCTAQLSAFIDQLVGLEEGIESLSINLYPNPASEEVKLSIEGELGENGMAELMNTLGQSVRVFALEGSQSTHVLSLEGISAGVYFMQLKVGEKLATVKLIVE